MNGQKNMMLLWYLNYCSHNRYFEEYYDENIDKHALIHPMLIVD